MTGATAIDQDGKCPGDFRPKGSRSDFSRSGSCGRPTDGEFAISAGIAALLAAVLTAGSLVAVPVDAQGRPVERIHDEARRSHDEGWKVLSAARAEDYEEAARDCQNKCYGRDPEETWGIVRKIWLMWSPELRALAEEAWAFVKKIWEEEDPPNVREARMARDAAGKIRDEAREAYDKAIKAYSEAEQAWRAVRYADDRVPDVSHVKEVYGNFRDAQMARNEAWKAYSETWETFYKASKACFCECVTEARKDRAGAEKTLMKRFCKR